MFQGDKVQVVAGRLRQGLQHLTGKIDKVVRESGKVCATFVDGFGDEREEASFLFEPAELQVVK